MLDRLWWRILRHPSILPWISDQPDRRSFIAHLNKYWHKCLDKKRCNFLNRSEASATWCFMKNDDRSFVCGTFSCSCRIPQFNNIFTAYNDLYSFFFFDDRNKTLHNEFFRLYQFFSIVSYRCMIYIIISTRDFEYYSHCWLCICLE